MVGLKCFYIIALSLTLLSQSAWAGDPVKRQHGAHEHGEGILHAVVEGKALYLEFISPAINIVGFEHAPHDKRQKEAVHKAISILEDSAKVFSPANAAKCRMVNVEVKSGMLDDDHPHEESDAHDGDNEDIHSEFRVRYQYVCSAPDKLTYLDTHLFEIFKGTEEIVARIITPRGQTAHELMPGASRLKF